MRTGRPKQPLILTEEERERLESLAHRARSQALLARRARVILACAEGLDNQTVARKLRCSLGMVGKWRARFLIFLVVRTASKLQRKPEVAAPSTKDCAYCFTAIPIPATRCPHCTSQLVTQKGQPA